MRRLVADAPRRTEPHVRECGGCGLFQLAPALAPNTTAQCGRCGTVLHRAPAHSLGHSLALSFATLVLLLILCMTSLMSVETAGISLTAGLFSGPVELVERDMGLLAAVVIFVVVIAPFGKVLGTLYVLVLLRRGTPPAHLRRVFAWVEWLRPWSMVEVFVFGVFVAYVKLGDLVHITLDSGLYVLLSLTVMLIWVDAALDREAVWERLGGRRREDIALRLSRSPEGASGAVGCETCRMVSILPHGHGRCPRCEARLHRRKPDSISRTWALMIAAAILYIPANYYPVLTVMQLGAGAPSTILGGVEELIASRMYPLAALVFFASIAIPMLKLVGLSTMLITTQTGRTSWLRGRTRLCHIVRWVGRWSMIDIFMEALLGALVKFGNVITIEPGMGALAFCGVVILTMLAAEAFDPRLMWDAAEREAPQADAPLAVV